MLMGKYKLVQQWIARETDSFLSENSFFDTNIHPSPLRPYRFFLNLFRLAKIFLVEKFWLLQFVL